MNNTKLAVISKSLVITLVVIAFYLEDLRMVFTGALSDEATFHILAIPILFAYLMYRKRKMIKSSFTTTETKQVFQRNLGTIAGILLCTVAILTYWYGSYTFLPLEYHMITLPFLVAGLVLILFSFQTLKQLFFPIAFLTFLTPPPSEILFSVGSVLANLAAVASNSLANLISVPATLTSSTAGPVITIIRPDTTSIAFNVSVACSGIYSIIGFTIFALFIAYITVGSWRKKATILIAGIPLIMALNILRITIVVAIGYNWGEALALEVFHSVGASVLMFIGFLTLLLVTEKAFKKPPQTTPCIACTPTPKNSVRQLCSSCGKILNYPKMKLHKTDLAKISGIILVTIALLSIQVPVFALTQSPGETIIQTPQGTKVDINSFMFPDIKGYNLSYSYRDTAYEQLTGNDAALVYIYSPQNRSQPPIYVAVQIGNSPTGQHRWETCLINYPLSQGDAAQVTQLEMHDVQLQDNPPVTARYFAFQYINTNLTEAVLYWYQTAMFNVNGSSVQKSVMISLVIYPNNPAAIQAAEGIERPIADAINTYWQPLKTWSAVTLTISQNGLTLASAAAAALIALTIYALYLTLQEKRSLQILYTKLPTQHQQLLKAVDNSDHSTQSILEEYQKLTNTQTTEEALLQKLDEAQKNGLITTQLKSKQDSPVLLWTNQVPKGRRLISIPLQFIHKIAGAKNTPSTPT